MLRFFPVAAALMMAVGVAPGAIGGWIALAVHAALAKRCGPG